jgi:hypothetical protein
MVLFWALQRRMFSPDADGGGGGGNGDKGDDKGDDGKQGDEKEGGDDDDGDDADLNDLDAEKLRDAIKKERQQRRVAVREARDAKKKVQEREDKEKQDADEEARKKGEWQQLATKAAAERDDARRALETERKTNAVILEATRQNFHDPEEAVKLLDLGKIAMGDDGKPVGVAKLVKDLADAKKHLVRTGQRPGMPLTDGKQGGDKSYSASRSYIAQNYAPKKTA